MNEQDQLKKWVEEVFRRKESVADYNHEQVRRACATL
jgi:hypothetical protein